MDPAFYAGSFALVVAVSYRSTHLAFLFSMVNTVA